LKVVAERRRHGEQVGPVVPTQVELLVEIRDLLRAQQGLPPQLEDEIGRHAHTGEFTRPV
jgi:large conductance mechanosensitive channel